MFELAKKEVWDGDPKNEQPHQRVKDALKVARLKPRRVTRLHPLKARKPPVPKQHL